ncbi:hypothetical protein DFP73DRAFT_17409 [Morchella snyderi]|nr:hypothetical protein DFP73DRAFT_17409 [Morchella snyderi]
MAFPVQNAVVVTLVLHARKGDALDLPSPLKQNEQLKFTALAGWPSFCHSPKYCGYHIGDWSPRLPARRKQADERHRQNRALGNWLLQTTPSCPSLSDPWP